eukprot:3343033-Rhodomonas_salina.1
MLLPADILAGWYDDDDETRGAYGPTLSAYETPVREVLSAYAIPMREGVSAYVPPTASPILTSCYAVPSTDNAYAATQLLVPT